MKAIPKTYEELREENDRLRTRLDEAEATVEAIRSGEVDAVVVTASPVEQIYTLEGADRPYRLLVEAMQQGVATLNKQGMILYCNPHFASLLETPQERVIGASLEGFLVDADKPAWVDMLARARTEPAQCELKMCRGDDGLFPAALLLNPLPFRGALCLLVTDLTQQKQTEELMRVETALRESEGRLRLFIEHAPAAIAMFDREMRYLAVSRRWLADYNLGDQNVIRKSHYEVVPEIADRWREVYQRGLKGEVLKAHEDGFERKDGTTQWLRWEVRPWRTGSGEVGGIIMFVEDITERKRAEEHLRRQAAFIQTINDNTTELIFMKDRASRLTYANAATLRVIGMTAEQALGSLDRDNFTEPAEYPAIVANDRRVAETGQSLTIEELYTSPDGKRHVFLSTKSPLRDERGEVIGVIGVAQDITDRKRAEEQLRASQQRLAAEVEALSRLHALSTRLLAVVDVRTALDDLLENAILTCEADFGNVQLYNPQINALEIAAQRGLRQDFLDHFRTVRVDEGSACAQAMRNGEPCIIEDVQLDLAFEPHRSIAAAADFRGVHSTPLRDRNSNVIGMLSIHFRQPHRSSEREQRLLDLYARHAADLIERTRFEEALKEADHRKDEFLATLAHELRNPLAPILNALQIIRIAPNTQVLTDARSMMERQLGQMVHLIDDLLDVSRITRGKVQLHKERVELATVVRNAVEACRPLIESCGHELQVTLPSEPVFLDADSTRLTQVFSNLLNNAAKYSDRGAHIDFTAEQKGDEVVTSVKDTGIGIASDMLRRVFELFTQVHRDQQRSHGGLGIGLTLAKRLVEMHGGDIQARSDGPGKGSEFVVRLPLLVTLAVSESRPVEESQTAARRVKVRILVVDDLKDSAESLAMLLRFMGNEVRTAYDGEEAVEAARAFQPDLLLLDIGLPRLDGYEACRRIRQLPLGKDMVLVAVTGWGQEEDRRKANEAGFDHHMVKPVAIEAVEMLLQSLPAWR
jgi:PAS domain S-box-containing protein